MGMQFLTVAGALKESGRIHVSANAIGRDWTPKSQKDPDRIAQRILRNIKAGDIINLHDGHADILGEDRSGTVAALQIVLRGLADRGLKAVTVSELLDSY